MRLEYHRGGSHKFYEATLRLEFQGRELLQPNPIYLHDIYRVRALCDQCRALAGGGEEHRAYDRWADEITVIIRDEGIARDRTLLVEMRSALYQNQVAIAGDTRWGRVGTRGQRKALEALCRPTNPPWNIAQSCIGRLAGKREEKIDKGYEVAAWNQGGQEQPSTDEINAALREAAGAINQHLNAKSAAATLTEAASLLDPDFAEKEFLL